MYFIFDCFYLLLIIRSFLIYFINFFYLHSFRPFRNQIFTVSFVDFNPSDYLAASRYVLIKQKWTRNQLFMFAPTNRALYYPPIFHCEWSRICCSCLYLVIMLDVVHLSSELLDSTKKHEIREQLRSYYAIRVLPDRSIGTNTSKLMVDKRNVHVFYPRYRPMLFSSQGSHYIFLSTRCKSWWFSH